jgi:hypothetical protein
LIFIFPARRQIPGGIHYNFKHSFTSLEHLTTA